MPRNKNATKAVLEEFFDSKVRKVISHNGERETRQLEYPEITLEVQPWEEVSRTGYVPRRDLLTAGDNSGIKMNMTDG